MEMVLSCLIRQRFEPLAHRISCPLTPASSNWRWRDASSSSMSFDNFNSSFVFHSHYNFLGIQCCRFYSSCFAWSSCLCSDCLSCQQRWTCYFVSHPDKIIFCTGIQVMREAQLKCGGNDNCQRSYSDPVRVPRCHFQPSAVETQSPELKLLAVLSVVTKLVPAIQLAKKPCQQWDKLHYRWVFIFLKEMESNMNCWILPRLPKCKYPRHAMRLDPRRLHCQLCLETLAFSCILKLQSHNVCSKYPKGVCASSFARCLVAFSFA